MRALRKARVIGTRAVPCGRSARRVHSPPLPITIIHNNNVGQTLTFVPRIVSDQAYNSPLKYAPLRFHIAGFSNNDNDGTYVPAFVQESDGFVRPSEHDQSTGSEVNTGGPRSWLSNSSPKTWPSSPPIRRSICFSQPSSKRGMLWSSAALTSKPCKTLRTGWDVAPTDSPGCR